MRDGLADEHDPRCGVVEAEPGDVIARQGSNGAAPPSGTGRGPPAKTRPARLAARDDGCGAAPTGVTGPPTWQPAAGYWSRPAK